MVEIADGFGLAVFCNRGNARRTAEGGAAMGVRVGLRRRAIYWGGSIVGLGSLQGFMLRFFVLAKVDEILFGVANIALWFGDNSMLADSGLRC